MQTSAYSTVSVERQKITFGDRFIRDLISTRTTVATRFSVIRLAALVLFASFALAGCAGGVNNPTLTSAPAPGFDAATAPIGRVSAEAAPGVDITPEDLSRISHAVQAELSSSYPDRMIAIKGPPRPNGVNIKLIFTEYDKGNAFARAMLAGLGQIHVHANVLLTDAATGASVANFEVTKDFGWGGIYGGSTSVEDVEAGFARSVSAIFKKA